MWGRTLTLDDLEIREHARFAAGDLLGRAPRLTRDEVQREPGLLLAVKRAVDEDRHSSGLIRGTGGNGEAAVSGPHEQRRFGGQEWRDDTVEPVAGWER